MVAHLIQDIGSADRVRTFELRELLVLSLTPKEHFQE